jgi:hypothetical protein
MRQEWIRASVGLGGAQVNAKWRLDDWSAGAGPGLSDKLWRFVFPGEGIREVETALAGQGAEAGAHHRPRPSRRILPRPLVLASAAVIRRRASMGDV